MIFLKSAWELLCQHWEPIVALCALFFTFYQTLATRKHNRLSVKPHLVLFPNTNLSPQTAIFSVELANNGLGSALIQNFQFYFDKKLIADCDHDNFMKFFESLDEVKGNNRLDHHITMLGKNGALAAGDKKMVAVLRFPRTSESEVEKYKAFLERFDLVIHYTSMYGEKCKPLSTMDDKTRLLEAV